MSKYKDLKQECYEANMQLNELNLVVYTFGNVSAVHRKDGVFAIKPSGVAYEVLKPEDIYSVDLDPLVEIPGFGPKKVDAIKHMLIFIKIGMILGG